MYVTSRVGSGIVAARRSITARPLFMSVVPHPYSRSPATWDGRLPLTGTVSMCPAITTRSDLPSDVRAITASPSRSTVRWGSTASASCIASASAFSLPLTDSISTIAAVNAAASDHRSSRMSPNLSRAGGRTWPLAHSRGQARSSGNRQECQHKPIPLLDIYLTITVKVDNLRKNPVARRSGESTHCLSHSKGVNRASVPAHPEAHLAPQTTKAPRHGDRAHHRRRAGRPGRGRRPQPLSPGPERTDPGERTDDAPGAGLGRIHHPGPRRHFLHAA